MAKSANGMTPKYPRQLSYGANNAVIALSETEVGKLFTGDTRSDIGSEAEKMRLPIASMNWSCASTDSTGTRRYKPICW